MSELLDPKLQFQVASLGKSLISQSRIQEVYVDEGLCVYIFTFSSLAVIVFCFYSFKKILYAINTYACLTNFLYKFNAKYNFRCI